MVRITSTGNPVVRAARRLAARPPSTRGDRRLVVEGPQAVGEALGHLERLFVSGSASARRAPLVERAAASGAEVVEVSDAVLASIAGTVTPQGLVGVATLPDVPLAAALEGARSVVVLVEVRDPGNAGTVVRTADAAGADAVVFTRDSVDPRNLKAVRASAGSVFHLPLVTGARTEEALDACGQAGLLRVATMPHAGTDYDRADLSGPVALVFGNEAHGLPPDAADRCDVAVRVPIHGRAESLNLAATAAIIVYEAARQRRRAGSDVP